MGLNIYLHWPEQAQVKHVVEATGYEYETTAEVDSVAHPEHYWKRNYLRSSYNGSGFNHAVGEVCEGRALYWVFEKMREGADDPYGGDFRPTDEQLQDARERALALLDEYRGRESVGVDWQSATPLRPQDGVPSMAEDAIAKYREEAARAFDPVMGGAYSNAVGVFYRSEPLKVRAIIPGMGFMGSGVYIIYERDKTWYVEACEILVEFIDEALSHPERSITWSG
jgi:hypothetical protein